MAYRSVKSTPRGTSYPKKPASARRGTSYPKKKKKTKKYGQQAPAMRREAGIPGMVRKPGKYGS